MTKVIVFGQEEAKKEEKKIEFIYYLDPCGALLASKRTPNDFDNLCYIGVDDKNEYDLILGWDNGCKGKSIYLGHWNDGVV